VFIRVAAKAGAALAVGLALSLVAGPGQAEEMGHARFASIMDSVFGRGAWRMTGGYRTPEREDELRAQGAMTVRPGGLSRHSLGRPGAPGAYDLVVDGMSPGEAAARLRKADAPFARYFPKGAHGSQGPHLHLEPYGFGSDGTARFQTASTGLPAVQEGVSRARSVAVAMPAPTAARLSVAQQEFALLRAGAMKDRADAQLQLGRAYALGFIVPRDFAAAQSWMDAAATNPTADPELQTEAKAALAEVTALLEVERAQQPARFARLRTADR